MARSPGVRCTPQFGGGVEEDIPGARPRDLRDTTVAKYERQLRELKRVLGKKEVEIAFLRNFLGQGG